MNTAIQTSKKNGKCRHPKDKVMKSSFNGLYCGNCGQKVNSA